MPNIRRLVAKHAWLPYLATLVLVVAATLIIASPRIKLSMASSSYASHTTYLIYDLKENAGDPIKLDTVATLTAKGNPKTTSLVYFPGAEQLAFGMVGNAKAIEQVPFVFKIRDSGGSYLDFIVLASGVEKYWGSRLLPFYMNRIPLLENEVYVLEVFDGSAKQGEVSFRLPAGKK